MSLLLSIKVIYYQTDFKIYSVFAVILHKCGYKKILHLHIKVISNSILNYIFIRLSMFKKFIILSFINK